jgi:hypothetical protein
MARRVLIPRVEVFHTGTFREDTPEEVEYTPADLASIVRNFAELRCGPRPLVEPPVGVGHESEEESLFERSDLPAEGEVVRLWTEVGQLDGQPVTFLVASLSVTPELAQWIEDGKLTRVSSEIYDEPPEGTEARVSGKVLKRVALLGFELPQLKGLRPLPLRGFADRLAVRVTKGRAVQRKGRLYCFAEVRKMAKADDCMGDRISELMHEGYPQKQAIAIAAKDWGIAWESEFPTQADRVQVTMLSERPVAGGKELLVWVDS